MSAYEPDGELAFGVRGGKPPYSRFTITKACQGRCIYAQLAGQLQAAAIALHEAFAREPECGVRWVKPPGLVRPGVWSYHVERTGDGRCREAVLAVAYLDERSDVALECGAHVYGDDVALAADVMTACTALDQTIGAGAPPLEVLFRHRMPMLGDSVYIPSLDGWRFARWIDNNGFILAEVELERADGRADVIVRKHRCDRCDDAQRLARISGDVIRIGMPARTVPLTAEISLDQHVTDDATEIFAVVAPPATSDVMTCSSRLPPSADADAPRIEAFCRTVLGRWRDDRGGPRATN